MRIRQPITAEKFVTATPEKLYFIITCNDNGCAINAADEKKIAALSAHNFERLQKLIDDLEKIGKLTSDTFVMALQRVTLSIKSVPQSKNVKQSVTEGHINKLDDHTTFFMKRGASRNESNSGGQSKINIGYTDVDAKIPSVSVKRLCLSDDEYEAPKDKFANREAKIQRFLGRSANWYPTKKGPAIAGEWQTGEALEDFNGDLSTYTYTRRFLWLACALTELNKLHANFRLHGDVKPGNVILDVAEDKLKFIDFGTTQKVNSTKNFVFSPFYCDMKEGEDDKQGKPKKLASDIFAMGYIVAYLFPELFRLEANASQVFRIQNGMMIVGMMPRPPIIASKVKADNFSVKERAIYALMDAMMEPTAELRCTSQQALQFSEFLSAHLTANADSINEAFLENSLQTTINRHSYETEDALRGSIRPSKFGAVATPAAPAPQPPKPEPEVKNSNQSNIKLSTNSFAANISRSSSTSSDEVTVKLGDEYKIDRKGGCTMM